MALYHYGILSKWGSWNIFEVQKGSSRGPSPRHRRANFRGPLIDAFRGLCASRPQAIRTKFKSHAQVECTDNELQNILIVSKPPEDEWWVKLCDLGLSRRSGDASGFTTVRGTPEFMAPETIGAPFIGDPALADPVKADMWCFGETISRALTGRTTFDMSSLLEYQRAQIAFPQQGLRAANVSQAGINFINRLMMRLPSERPGTELQDVWLRTHTDFDVDYAASPHTGIGNNPLTHQSLTSNVTAQHTQASGQWTATMPLLEPHHSDQSTQASGTWTSTVTGPFERTHSSDHPTVPTIGAGHSQGAPPPQREPSPSGMEFHDPPSRPHSRLKVWTPSDSDHHGLQKTERDLVSGSHPIDVSDKQPAEGIEGSQRTPTSPSHNESQSEATDGKIGTMSKARVLVTSQEDKVMAEPQPPRARLHGLRMAPTQPSPQAVLGGEADGQIPGHQDMGGKSIAGENARLIKGVSAEKGQQEEILPESLKNTQPDKKPFPKKLTIFEQLSAVEKSRMSERQRPEARESKAAKLNDLRRFSENFKVNSAVPVDIIPILSVAAQARLEGRERSPSVGTAGTSRNSDSSAANDAPSRPSLTTPPSVSGSTLRRSWADVAKVAKPSVDKKFIQYKTAPIITIGADGTASHPLGRPLTVNTAIPVGQNAIENETQATTVRDSKGKRNTKRRPAKQRSNTLMKPTYPRG